MAGHHARMNSTTPCRCSECSAEFVPDPRVGDRQVTCGAPECQRARHAKRCRQWHRANKETTASHYGDVVVRFRRRQPDYQRRWRWCRRLREIREKTALLGGAMLAGLRGLVRQAQDLARRVAGVVQTGVLAGEKLDRAMAVVSLAIAAFEQLEAHAAQLRRLGL